MITVISQNKFKVNSMTDAEKNYLVTSNLSIKPETFNCDCSAFKYRKNESDQCKHIIEVKMFLNTKHIDLYYILGQLKACLDSNDIPQAITKFSLLESILMTKEFVKKVYS